MLAANTEQLENEIVRSSFFENHGPKMKVRISSPPEQTPMSKGKRLTEELIFKMLKEIDTAASIASVDSTRGDADQP